MNGWRRWIAAVTGLAFLIGLCLGGSGEASASAVPVVVLHVPASVAGPYMAADAAITVTPHQVECPLSWQLQEWVSGRWVSVFNPYLSTEANCGDPDIAFPWSSKPNSTMKLRALLLAQPGLTPAVYSAVVTVKVGAAKPPAWLTDLNKLRALDNSPAVPLSPSLDTAAFHHARYMFHAGELTHVEDPKNKWYTKDGARAGGAGDEDLSATPVSDWSRAAYHQNVEIDPSIVAVGLGTYDSYDSYTAVWNAAYRQKAPYLEFPANGKTTWLTSFYPGREEPDPFLSCPPAWEKRQNQFQLLGAPMEFSEVNSYAVAGAKKTVTAALVSGGKHLQLCVVYDRYTEVTYLLPLLPLTHSRTYTVSVTYDGKLQAKWAFSVHK